MKGEFFGEPANRRVAAWLGEHVYRTGLDGVHRRLRARLRQRTHDHHRQRMMLHEDPEKREAVHPRHLEVERQHVGIEGDDLLAGHVGITGGTHHLDLRILAQGVADRLADERRIVDDEDSNPLFRAVAHG